MNFHFVYRNSLSQQSQRFFSEPIIDSLSPSSSFTTTRYKHCTGPGTLTFGLVSDDPYPNVNTVSLQSSKRNMVIESCKSNRLSLYRKHSLSKYFPVKLQTKITSQCPKRSWTTTIYNASRTNSKSELLPIIPEINAGHDKKISLLRNSQSFPSTIYDRFKPFSMLSSSSKPSFSISVKDNFCQKLSKSTSAYERLDCSTNSSSLTFTSKTSSSELDSLVDSFLNYFRL